MTDLLWICYSVLLPLVVTVVIIIAFGGYALHRVAENLRQPESGIFGTITKHILVRKNRVLELEAVRLSRIEDEHQVLELGFGPGFGLQAAYELIKHGSGSVSGIDFSEAMVNEASKLLTKEISTHQVKLTLGSVQKMPYDSNKFDRVYHCNCYYFWPDMISACKEIYRVMAPGSFMVCTLNLAILNKSKWWGFMSCANYDPGRYMEALTLAGFSDVHMEQQEKDTLKYQVIYAHVGAKQTSKHTS